MGENVNKDNNCFSVFSDSPKKKEPSIQVLYDYEKHYMELVRKYSAEISMITDMLSNLRSEQSEFYEKTLPQISSKLKQDESIDDDMKKVWLKRLVENMDKSFELSDIVIKNYTTKKIEEFKAAVNEKLHKL